MSSSIRPAGKAALSFFVFVCIFSCSARAADYNQDRNRYLMPASRGNIQAAHIDWQEVQLDKSLSSIRQTQINAASVFNLEMVSRKAGGGSVSTQIQDKALASLVNTELAADPKGLTRSDMLSIFGQVESDGVVSSTEFNDLRTIINNPSTYSIVDYVRDLSNEVINGNAWNLTYQGRSLGNLAPGSAGTQLQSLVSKWFLGTDNPLAVDDYGNKYNYRLASGSLFVNGPSYADIDQGYVGDCWLMASFAEIALRDTSIISNMFIDNGDSTYTVRLFNNGIPRYVTVDKQLPVDSNGRLIFGDFGASISNPNNELWTALAEKAVVEEQASLGYKNAYTTISGGYIGVGLSDITGHSYTMGNSLAISGSYNGFNAAVNNWNAGRLMGFASKSSGTTLGVLSGHAYAVVGYNATTRQFTLFNPWGLNNGYAPGLLTLSWASIQSNFSYFDTAVQ